MKCTLDGFLRSILKVILVISVINHVSTNHDCLKSHIRVHDKSFFFVFFVFGFFTYAAELGRMNLVWGVPCALRGAFCGIEKVTHFCKDVAVNLYIYICCHPQTSYHNSSVWLDTREDSS